MRRLLLVAAAVSALMLAAACSGFEFSGPGDDDDDIASAGGEAGESEEAAEDLSQEETLLAFSACMRDNGVEEFPDLDGSGGGVQIGGDIADDPDFEAALEACQHWTEGLRGSDGGNRANGPDVDDETLQEFADCMRENGVEEFPDPSSEGMAVTRDMVDDPDFEDARDACSDIMEFGLGGGGN